MRWIWNIPHNFGWRGKVAQIGTVAFSLFLFWNAQQPASQLAKAVSGWEKEVESQSKFMELASQLNATKGDPPRTLSSKEKKQIRLIAMLGNSWLLGSMTAVLAGMILVGGGLLLAQNWARIAVITVYLLWFLVTPWSIILAHSNPQNLILGYWRPVAVILFLLWRPTRALFR